MGEKLEEARNGVESKAAAVKGSYFRVIKRSARAWYMRVRGDPGKEAAPEFLYSEPLRALFEKFATNIEYDDEAGSSRPITFVRSLDRRASVVSEAYTWRIFSIPPFKRPWW